MPFNLNKINDIERIQDFHKRYTNRKVREYFRNTPNDSSTPESLLKALLTHEENDTALLTLLRLNLWDELRKTEDVSEIIYGVPATHFHDSVRFKPQVYLYFRQTLEDQKADKLAYPVQLRVNIRLTSEFLSKNKDLLKEKIENNNELKRLAKDIYTTFKNKYYYKGIEQYSYIDNDNSYQLRIMAKTETHAKKLIEDILKIQNHRPDWQAFLKHHKDSGKFNPVSGEVRDTETIVLFGDRIKKDPLKRLSGKVRLHYAELQVHGQTRSVQLVETRSKTGRARRQALFAYDYPTT